MSRFAQTLMRTTQHLRGQTAKALRMQGADEPFRAPQTLLTFSSREDLQNYAIGCDTDIGGLSTAHLDLVEPTEKDNEQTRPYVKFWGEMRLGARKELEGKIRSGYAGFRSKRRRMLIGEITDDVSMHRFLALRLRAAGHPRTRNSYYVNIQTDGPVETDLWQHRLYFRREDGGWEDIYIPFDEFVLTNTGEVSQQQMTMFRERLRTIGISILGGNSGVEGPYELGIDSIRAVNEEDVPSDHARRERTVRRDAVGETRGMSIKCRAEKI
ncbi:complex I intermediate-associated protein CIA30 [Wolfiporia cocos MD-104 SS10]|uniref:Complex I intermediate-associated protein CIA30 n=1 Tax=Wolfiporia cocos (strain MD-104) TaxID=742152 RepID=A0A2H3JKE4_WOLCO|nr:complex I intermediate-associated protein CIA30 [Wolfiporia cocos MD-104 SS10]